jgi:hypothetical protein
MADEVVVGYLTDKPMDPSTEDAMSELEPTPITNQVAENALESATSAPTPPPKPVDPRRTTTHVVRQGRPRPGQSTFLAWPAASSLIFLLSAACLLGGAWTVFETLGIDPDQIGERLAMVGTVHLYELALVGVALLLCRFQRANPDAIGPVLLGGCFLVGAAVTLDLVSIDAPYLTLAMALTGVVLACGKARVLSHLGGGASPALLLAPLALLIAWNLLGPTAMGLYQYHSVSGMARQEWWMPGWGVVLLGCGLLVIGIVRDDSVGVERLRPFLRRITLRWVIGLAIGGCSALHLLVLGYVHSLDVTLGEILPMIALLCLGAVDLRHRAAGKALELDHLLLCLPCALALTAVFSEEHGLMSNPHADGVVFTPALLLLTYGALVWRLGDHRQQLTWRWVAAASALLGVLVWGARAELISCNWSLTVVVAALGFAVRAVIRNEPITLAKALMVAATVALLQPTSVLWMRHQDLSAFGAVLASIGVIVLTCALVWRTGKRPAEVRLALWIATVGVLLLCHRHAALSLIGLAGGLGVMAMHAMAWWRTRDAWALASLLLPSATLVPVLMPAHKGWLAVWAAFALLGVGVSLSWLRVRETQVKRRPMPAATHHSVSMQPTSV